MLTEQAETAESPRHDASLIADALGSAWTTHRLYPNPSAQPAFARAVDQLSMLKDAPITLEIGAGVFLFGGDPLPVDRDGVDRLARQLYVRDIEAIRLGDAPTVRDLDALFRVIAGDDNPDGDTTAMQGALDALGTTWVALKQRTMLTVRHAAGGDDLHEGRDGERRIVARESPIAAIIEAGADPEKVRAALEEMADATPGGITGGFLDAYLEIHEVEASLEGSRDLRQLLTSYWQDDDPGRILRTFVETMFLLPRNVQLELMGRFLTSPRELASRVFLDQLSGAELASYAADLEEEAYGELLEYIKESADVAGSGENDPIALISCLEGARDVKKMRIDAVARIGGLLEAEAPAPDQCVEAARSLAAAVERELQATGSELTVMRALAEIENRERRFRRLVRVWASRVALLASRGEFAAAAEVAAALRDDPRYLPEFAPVVNDALTGILTRDLLSVIVELALDGEAAIDAEAFLNRLGGPAVDALLEQLAEEESQQHRRALLDILVPLGRRHLSKLIRSTDDPRWYMVRNLAFLLGKSGDERAIDPLHKLRHHEDHRVRVEALRALVALLGDSSKLLVDALGDDNERVRRTAATLLSVADVPGLDARLVDIVEAAELGAEDLNRVAAIVVKRGNPDARAALERLASKSFAMRNRAAVAAAKQALGR